MCITSLHFIRGTRTVNTIRSKWHQKCWPSLLPWSCSWPPLWAARFRTATRWTWWRRTSKTCSKEVLFFIQELFDSVKVGPSWRFSWTQKTLALDLIPANLVSLLVKMYVAITHPVTLLNLWVRNNELKRHQWAGLLCYGCNAKSPTSSGQEIDGPVMSITSSQYIIIYYFEFFNTSSFQNKLKKLKG